MKIAAIVGNTRGDFRHISLFTRTIPVSPVRVSELSSRCPPWFPSLMPLERARWKAGPSARWDTTLRSLRCGPYNRAMATRPTSASGLQTVDDMLAEVGLRHGRRQVLKQGIEPQPKHPWQVPTSKPHPARSRKSGARRSEVEVVSVPAFATIDWLIYGFSTRTGGTTTAYRPSQRAGELNLGFTASDDPAHVAANRRRFFSAVASDAEIPAITLRQVHSSIIRRVSAA